MSLPGHPHEPQLPRPQGPKQLKIYWQILTYWAISMCNFFEGSFLIQSHGCQRVPSPLDSLYTCFANLLDLSETLKNKYEVFSLKIPLELLSAGQPIFSNH